ncbi:sulfatase-like hydrolase/transferase [Sphingomonas suaedae]|uniref:Sulfatase-like hydrolase/transferase n=1 Tax=Sphingomonas suaedae TaxID=2599297 RepID=A0A518RHN3_9SPHN|nr:sulfatase-like hydrolase/transferase [Sphingomonas suaedae]QDX26944.1 sulfatase-like hydrolase/transferase [Sphingomonas suaedae]
MTAQRVSRRKAIGLAAALLATALGSGTALAGPQETTARPAQTAPQRPPTKPNILFVLVDDMGYGDLSITGNRLVATPHIDALARDGLMMTQFYDASPICSPSRAGFMTGRFPARDRFVTFVDGRRRNAAFNQADWLDPKLPTLPRTLQQVGYATGQFGKWHLGGGRDIGDAPLPTAYGFDESYVQWEGLGPRVLPTDLTNKLGEQSAALGKGPIDWLPRAQLTARFIDKTLDFVRRSKDKSWFAQLWLTDMHSPWVPSAEQLAATKGKGRNPREDNFLAVLVAMDAEIGRLVEGLRAAGELDDTLIVFTSDNGPTIGANAPGSAGPYRGRKASLYEGGVRQPLIIRWPGQVPAGRRDADSVVQAVDLLPTMAAITGARNPSGIDGIDVSAAWRGKPITSRPDLYSHIARAGGEAFGPLYAIRSGPWKLLMNVDGSAAELYNIEQDPGEQRDRKADSPSVFKDLSRRLASWIATLPPPATPRPRR